MDAGVVRLERLGAHVNQCTDGTVIKVFTFGHDPVLHYVDQVSIVEHIVESNSEH